MKCRAIGGVDATDAVWGELYVAKKQHARWKVVYGGFCGKIGLQLACYDRELSRSFQLSAYSFLLTTDR